MTQRGFKWLTLGLMLLAMLTGISGVMAQDAAYSSCPSETSESEWTWIVIRTTIRRGCADNSIHIEQTILVKTPKPQPNAPEETVVEAQGGIETGLVYIKIRVKQKVIVIDQCGCKREVEIYTEQIIAIVTG